MRKKNSIILQIAFLYMGIIQMSIPFAATTSISRIALGARQLELIADRSKIPELNTQTTDRGHMIWDLEEYRGRIYIGMGDYDVNTGPIDVVSYDPSTNKFITDYKDAPAEATEYVRNVNGYLFVTMTDPRGWEGPAFVGLKPGSNNWITAATIPTTAHYFDITMFGGRIYIATGDWTTQKAPPLVPSSESSRVYSSGDNGSTWTVDLAAPHGRFYDIGADSTTIFVNAIYDSYVKKDGKWQKVTTSGNYRPVTLNGVMRMMSRDFSGFYKLNGLALEQTSQLPCFRAYGYQNNVSSPDQNINTEVFWMIGESKSDTTKREIWATTDFVDWTLIVGIADQGSNKDTYSTFTRIVYYNNILYCGNTDGSFYAIKGVFDFTKTGTNDRSFLNRVNGVKNTTIDISDNTVALSNSSSKAITCSVYKLSGEVVCKLNVPAGRSKSFNMSEVVPAKGIYIVSLPNIGSVLTKTIIVR